MGQANTKTKMDESAPSSGGYDYLFKLMINGDSGVGKTSLLLRFADNTFTPNYSSTIGIDFKIRTITIDGQRIKLQIWDTWGRESFRILTSAHFRGTHGMVVVYDVTSGESFDRVKKYWLPIIIDQYCKEGILKILVGNKCDDSEHRVVLETDARRFAEEMNIEFIETSAKDNINVQEMFNAITRLVLLDAKLKSPQNQANHQGAGCSRARDQRQKSDNSYCTML